MDWKIFFATFSAIFLAELGDKTQIANLCMATRSKSWVTVFTASVLAFALVTFITILLGKVLAKHIQPEHVRYAGGVSFIIIGLLMLWGKV
jgi:Ca2+/H+ antiporter, TMEM165/GDT1 family